MRQLTRAFGQTDRLRPIAKLVTGSADQHPRHLFSAPARLGFNLSAPGIGRPLPGYDPVGQASCPNESRFGGSLN